MIVRAAWLLAALLAAGAAAAAPARVQVELFGIDDEVRASARATLGIAAAARSGRLEEAEVRRLHARAPAELRTVMRAYGRYRASVESHLTNTDGTWRARYVVEPGPPVVVAEVGVRVTGPGADAPAIRSAAAAFPLAQGDVLNHMTYMSGKANLREAASEGGFLDAAFDTSEIRIDADMRSAVIRLDFSTGPRFRFGEVRWRQDVLHPEFLTGYPEFREGEPFDLNEMIALQKRLGDLPYFSTVEVVPRRDRAEDGRIPVDVNLTPGKPQRWLLGVGFGTDTGVHGRAGLELRRINRRAHRAETDVEISGIERTAAAQYFVPWPYPRTELLTLSAGFQDLDPQTSESKTLRLAASLARGRGGVRQTYTLTYQREEFRVGPDAATSDLLIPELGWSFVRADDRVYARRGLRLRVRLRGAAEQALSDAAFGQISGGAKWIGSPFFRTRVLVRGEGGYTQTEQFRSLPPSIRFFAGGAQSVRGYAFQGLGPVDEEGRVIGGEALVVGSVELEQRVLEDWGVAAFYDLGNAMRSLRDPLEDGAGAGLRWISPIGLVRADVAWALSEPGTPWRFHLALGPDL